MLLDAEWRPRTVWRFEAVLVLLGGNWPPRGLLSGRWPPAGCSSPGLNPNPSMPSSSFGAGAVGSACGAEGSREGRDPGQETLGQGFATSRRGSAGGGLGRWVASGSGSDSPGGSSGDARARSARRRVRRAPATNLFRLPTFMMIMSADVV